MNKLIWDDFTSYKKCRKKLYDAYVCMPPKNTVVIDKLEQVDIYNQLGKRDYFTEIEIEGMTVNNPRLLATLQQLVAQGVAFAVTESTPFVLAGTQGELSVITSKDLSSTYMFLQNNQPLPINMKTLQSRMNKGYLDWTVVRVSRHVQSMMYMACFVPSSKKGQLLYNNKILGINSVGVNHGKGDFVVCNMLPNGKPDFEHRFVVNGNVFADTFDNHGWAGCLLSNSVVLNIMNLPKLIDINNMSKSDSAIDVLYDSIISKNRSFMYPVTDVISLDKSNGESRLIIKPLNPTGDSIVVTVVFKDSKYVFSGHGEGSTSSKENALSFVLEMAYMTYRGMFSCFYAPKMNSVQMNALMDYSFVSLTGLVDGVVEGKLSFDKFLSFYDLHNYLQRCKVIRHMPLYRGVNIDFVHENMVLKCNSFTSTSVTLQTPSDFAIGSGRAIFRIRDAYGLNGFYLNSISEYRNTEWEVLLDAGYDMHIGKILYRWGGTPVYDCIMVRNSSNNRFSINNYTDSDLIIYDLYNDLSSHKEIVSKCVLGLECEDGHYYIELAFEEVKNSNICKLVVLVNNSGQISLGADERGRDSLKLLKKFESSSKGRQEVISYILNICSSASVQNTEDGMLVYNQVAQKFTDNGFLVISDELESNAFKLVLSGDIDDHIVCSFKVSVSDLKLRVNVHGKSNNVAINKTKDFDSIEDLVVGAYNLIVHSFNLDSSNRCTSVVNLIARYTSSSVNKSSQGSKLFSYRLSELPYVINAQLDGNGIVYNYNGRTLFSNHFDNITSVASDLYKLIEEDVG